MVAEYDGAGALLRRHVHGPGSDEPIVTYEGASLTNRRFLLRDERGSIVSVSDSAGAVIAINSYDEYGIPASTNVGRFQYTGQAWLQRWAWRITKRACTRQRWADSCRQTPSAMPTG